jgi:hypothetical protein
MFICTWYTQKITYFFYKAFCDEHVWMGICCPTRSTWSTDMIFPGAFNKPWTNEGRDEDLINKNDVCLGGKESLPENQHEKQWVFAIRRISINHDRLTPPGVKNVTYIFGVPLCRVSGPWLYVGCFTQIHKVNVKTLHYIFRLGKQIYKSHL